MSSVSNKFRISTATTSLFAANQLKYVNINKTLVGAVTLQDGDGTTNNTIATFAAGTLPQTFFYECVMQYGIRVITASADDLTIVA